MPSGAIQVTITGVAIHGTETFVPIKVNGANFGSGFFNGVYSSDGSDIFVSSISGVVWAHDLIHFNKTNQELEMYVKVPSVTSGTAITFLVQYGYGTSVDNNSDTYDNVFGGTHNFGTMMHFQNDLTDSTKHGNTFSWYGVGSATYESDNGTFGNGLILTGSSKRPRRTSPLTLPSNFLNDRLSIGVKTKITNRGGTAYSLFNGNGRGWNIFFPYGGDRRPQFILGEDDHTGSPPIMNVRCNTNLSLNQPYELIFTVTDPTDASTADIYISGVKQATTTIHDNFSSTLQNGNEFNIASQYDPMDGNLDELWMTDYDVSDDIARTLFEAGLSGNLTITAAAPVAPTTLYPTITVHPQSASKQTGEYHTFTVRADDALYYQWQLDGANIYGETDSDLFLSYIDSEDAGVYRCAVSNEYGTVYSNNATLTVDGAGDPNASGRYGGSLYGISGYIDPTYVTSGMVNIPVPIGEEGLPTAFWDHVYRADAHDLVVTSVSGVPYEREIVVWDPTNKKLRMWVKFPELDKDNNTYFILQYGSTQLNIPNSSQTWTHNYTGDFNHVAVYHFSNGEMITTYASEGIARLEESVNGNDLIPRYSHQHPVPDHEFSSYKVLGSGRIDGGAVRVNPLMAGDIPLSYYGAAHTSTLQFGSGLTNGTNYSDPAITVRTWLYATEAANPDWSDQCVARKGTNIVNGEWDFGFLGDNLGFYMFDSRSNSGLYRYIYAESIGSMTGDAQTWKHFAGTYDGSANYSGINIYENGDAVGAVNKGDAGLDGGVYSGMLKTAQPLEVGRRKINNYFISSYSYMTRKNLDELFIMKGEMQPQEIKTQYNLENYFNTSDVQNFNDEFEFTSDPYVPPAETDPPTFLVGLSDQIADEGDTVTFQVTVDGTAPFVYRWSKNGVSVGGDSYKYVITGVDADDTGEYAVSVSNAYGTAISYATLTVVEEGELPEDEDPDPVPSGTPPDPSGLLPSGSAVTLTASGYIFINKSFTGTKASEASGIYRLNIGNLFYEQTKNDYFLFGNLRTSGVSYYLYLSGLNTELYDNLRLSLDNVTWGSNVYFSAEPDDIKRIYLKYTAGDNPDLGYGTMLIGAGVVNYE